MNIDKTKGSSFADNLRDEEESPYMKELTGSQSKAAKAQRLNESKLSEHLSKSGATSKSSQAPSLDIERLDGPPEKGSRKVQVACYLDQAVYNLFSEHRRAKGWKSESQLMEHIISSYYSK